MKKQAKESPPKQLFVVPWRWIHICFALWCFLLTESTVVDFTSHCIKAIISSLPLHTSFHREKFQIPFSRCLLSDSRVTLALLQSPLFLLFLLLRLSHQLILQLGSHSCSVGCLLSNWQCQVFTHLLNRTSINSEIHLSLVVQTGQSIYGCFYFFYFFSKCKPLFALFFHLHQTEKSCYHLGFETGSVVFSSYLQT